LKTVYVDHYRRWKIDNEDNLGDKLGLKKSHFVLGDDSMKEPYQSLYKRDHIQFDKIAASTLDTETLKDLRRHHFELGTDKGLPKSEAQENFVARELPKGTKEEFEKAEALMGKPPRHSMTPVWATVHSYIISKYFTATHPNDPSKYSNAELHQIADSKGATLPWNGWVPVKSWGLWAAAHVLGVYCEDENNAFIDCKIQNKDPYHCRQQSITVTKCAKKMFDEVYSTCGESFDKYAFCIRKTQASNPLVKGRYFDYLIE